MLIFCGVIGVIHHPLDAAGTPSFYVLVDWGLIPKGLGYGWHAWRRRSQEAKGLICTKPAEIGEVWNIGLPILA